MSTVEITVMNTSLLSSLPFPLPCFTSNSGEVAPVVRLALFTKPIISPPHSKSSTKAVGNNSLFSFNRFVKERTKVPHAFVPSQSVTLCPKISNELPVAKLPYRYQEQFYIILVALQII